MVAGSVGDARHYDTTRPAFNNSKRGILTVMSIDGLPRATPAVFREQLRARDGDNCCICGKLMDFTLPRDHPRAPTIEHKIPRAAGGRTTMDNCGLAHARPCNHAKGSRYEGQNYSRLLGRSGETPSPYGIGKRRRARLGDWPRDEHGRHVPPGPPADASQDWDTPVLPCWP
jgi:hypothetical protein